MNANTTTTILLSYEKSACKNWREARLCVMDAIRSIDCTGDVFKLRCVADVDFPIHKFNYIVGAGMSTVILSVATDVIQSDQQLYH